jgi:probable addiction module antidote protein
MTGTKETKSKSLSKAKAQKPSARSLAFEDWMVESLIDPVEAAAYLGEAAKEDSATLLLALRYVAKAHGMATIARHAKIGEKSLFNMLSEKGNPTVESMRKILAPMGLRLSIEPIAA